MPLVSRVGGLADTVHHQLGRIEFEGRLERRGEIARLTLDTLADLPEEVRTCLHWERDPVRRASIRETTKLESMVPFLATTGSAGPFIGLFGTVIGILFAFVEIAESKEASAASIKTVGPHIAEALFATAIGLVAAIPAVMAFNFFMRRIRVLRSEMSTFEQDYLNIIKRHFLR